MTGKAKYAVAVAALLMTSTAHAQTTVVDGDTLNYRGIVVHLWGIDAPENGETCADGWNAGQTAKDHLMKLVQGKEVVCALQGPDKGPRVAAICKAGDKDLSSEMANAGMAWALTGESDAYTVQETNAMSAIRGVHAHPCLKAWEWRSKQLAKP